MFSNFVNLIGCFGGDGDWLFFLNVGLMRMTGIIVS